MAAGDQKVAFGAKWDAIAANDLADNGNALSAARDNSANLYIGAWITVKIDDGAGADADGVTLSLLVSTDDGTTYSDANGHPILTLPSPDSGTVIRHIELKSLPEYYKLNLLNESGAACDGDVDVQEYYYTQAQS